MATSDLGMSYHSPAQISPQSNPMATSTKVVNLSRAQPGVNQSGQVTYQSYGSQQPQQQFQTTTYGHPAQQGQGQVNYAHPAQPAVEAPFTAVQRSGIQGSTQPQVFTVGSSQPLQMHQQQGQPQTWQQSQTTPQYKVIATPIQTSNLGQPIAYGVGQPTPQQAYSAQPNVMYYGQQSQQQTPGTQAYPTSQPKVYQQSYQQTASPPQPSYQQPQHQAYQQQAFQGPQQQPQQQALPTSQVVYARTANQPSMTYQTPSSVVSQPAPQNYPIANQQSVIQQPMSAQTGQRVGQQAFGQPPRFQNVPVSPSQPIQVSGQVINQPQPQQVYQHQQQQQPIQQQASYQIQPKPAQSVQITPGSWHSQPISAQNYQPVQQVQPTTYNALPPTVPNQGLDQQVRRRIPSSGGQSRTVKVKSLPMRNSASLDNLDATGPPQFVVQPVSQLTIPEGEPANLTARVRPAGDSTLTVEWYRNGKPLPAASRFTTTFDRGYAVLDFLYTNEEDNGDYSCVATNSQGQDQSSSCHVTIIPEEGVVTESQLPEESMIANLAMMEDHLVQNGLSRSSRYPEELRQTNPPNFLKPLAPQIGLKESAPAHFETVVEPANDASLTVEWYKDGKPVSMGCRFNAVLDRGFAMLDIHYCYPEDNGAYFCIAKNSAGQVQSNVVELQCNADVNIVTNSLLSKESVSYLQSLDSWGSETMAGYDTITREEEETPSAPTFDILPVALNVIEGSPARFLVKAGGYPKPKVYWYINGEIMASQGGGGNWRIYQDGGISYLEFHRVGSPGQLAIRVLARNSMGEAAADTMLTIQPQLDFRPDLRHVQPENPFKKLAQLKKVECSNELSSAFKRPKAQALDLRRLERELEYRGRSAASIDVEEAENLYSRVQSQLRTNRRSSLPPPSVPQTPKLQTVVIQPQPKQQQQQPQQHYARPQQPQQQQRPQQPQLPPQPQQYQTQPTHTTSSVVMNVAPPRPPVPQQPTQFVQPVAVKPQPMQPAPAPVNVPPPAPVVAAPPPPPPPPAPVAAPPPPPAPPAPVAAPPQPPPPPVMNAFDSGQMIGPAAVEMSELSHTEVSADFTIEL